MNVQTKVYFRWKPHLTQFEFGSVLIHDSLSIKDQNSECMDVYDFSTQEVLGGSCSICMATLKGGYSGFKSEDSEVILKRLGPLMGRVSYKQEVLKSCNTLASPVIYLIIYLSWFKHFVFQFGCFWCYWSLEHGEIIHQSTLNNLKNIL